MPIYIPQMNSLTLMMYKECCTCMDNNADTDANKADADNNNDNTASLHQLI